MLIELTHHTKTETQFSTSTLNQPGHRHKEDMIVLLQATIFSSTGLG